MKVQECFEFLLKERKIQNDKIDFTVDYCRLLSMVAFKDEFDEKAFNELANNNEDDFLLFEIKEDKQIVFNGAPSIAQSACKYNRDESDFFVDQLCEADDLEQLHSRIYVDGRPCPIKKTLALLGLSRNAFYKQLSSAGARCEINGHIVERVHIWQTKINI